MFLIYILLVHFYMHIFNMFTFCIAPSVTSLKVVAYDLEMTPSRTRPRQWIRNRCVALWPHVVVSGLSLNYRSRAKKSSHLRISLDTHLNAFHPVEGYSSGVLLVFLYSNILIKSQTSNAIFVCIWVILRQVLAVLLHTFPKVCDVSAWHSVSILCVIFISCFKTP